MVNRSQEIKIYVRNHDLDTIIISDTHTAIKRPEEKA